MTFYAFYGSKKSVLITIAIKGVLCRQTIKYQPNIKI